MLTGCQGGVIREGQVHIAFVCICCALHSAVLTPLPLGQVFDTFSLGLPGWVPYKGTLLDWQALGFFGTLPPTNGRRWAPMGADGRREGFLGQ